MLVFKCFENNEFSILDTEDGVIEQISGEDLLSVLCITNLEIQGLGLNSKGFIVDDAKTVLYKPSKVKNSNLIKAKKAKNDEFYTQLSDIEKELAHYPIETFKDKVIYCPMDVATNTGKILQSQFVKYFQLNAHRLQFKKLIATCLVDKAAGEGVALEDAQNCYILERKQVDSIQRNIYGYTHGDGNSNPVVEEVDDFGLKYKTKDQNEHAIPYHIVNQAVTDSSGKIVIVKKYIDHYDEETGKPVLSDKNKGLTWMFEITSRVGIYDYVLSGNEGKLSTRKFPDKIKLKKYKQQGGKCALCQRPLSIDDMTADHITPWSQGGKTVEGNYQVLCVECNSKKSAKNEVATNEVTCKNCGKPVKIGMFCQFCGTRN